MELEDDELCKPPPTEDSPGEGESKRKKHEDGNEKIETEDNKKADKLNVSSDSKSSSSIVEERVIKSATGSDVFVPDVLPSIRKLVLKDRDVLEKGTKAYTSYIRAYKEHHCGFIFRYVEIEIWKQTYMALASILTSISVSPLYLRFASLDLGLLATSFSLLRLPKMPELRDKQLQNFKPAGPEINIHAISFKDKAREAARQKRLANELAAGGKNAKQIKAEQRAAERIAKAKERRATEIAKGRNPHKKKGKQARIFDEWAELAK